MTRSLQQVHQDRSEGKCVSRWRGVAHLRTYIKVHSFPCVGVPSPSSSALPCRRLRLLVIGDGTHISLSSGSHAKTQTSGSDASNETVGLLNWPLSHALVAIGSCNECPRMRWLETVPSESSLDDRGESCGVTRLLDDATVSASDPAPSSLPTSAKTSENLRAKGSRGIEERS